MPRKEGYGPNPADNPVRDPDDPSIRINKPIDYSKMSKAAMKGKDQAMTRAKARRAAIRKLIPASPTK